VLSYLNLLRQMQSHDINIVLVPIFFCLNVVCMVLLWLGYRAFQQRAERINKEVAERNFHKNKAEYFVNLLMVLYTTVLTIPIFQTSATAFYCSASSIYSTTQ
jgi:heme/copper-type cytochrome/quinol oxidase subunit 2